MKKVFIDGRQGTTGLRIVERLFGYGGIELMSLDDDKRKDPECRKKALNSCDVAILCLPDDAAREAISFVENPDTVIIDASSAHRTEQGWAYGFPELGNDFEQAIKTSKRISVPGCHASGFAALVAPLTANGLLDKKTLLTCFSVTGYSGGGKKMIAQYEAGECSSSSRQYALGQTHKHLPEMTKYAQLETPPVFCPTVGAFYSGMVVTVPVFAQDLNCGVDELKKFYSSFYNGGIVGYAETVDNGGFIDSDVLSGNDGMTVSVYGNEQRILLVARYDNLGKGASGAAVECLNLVLGNDITANLNLEKKL